MYVFIEPTLLLLLVVGTVLKPRPSHNIMHRTRSLVRNIEINKTLLTW